MYMSVHASECKRVCATFYSLLISSMKLICEPKNLFFKMRCSRQQILSMLITRRHAHLM